jgi:hypothetical protein
MSTLNTVASMLATVGIIARTPELRACQTVGMFASPDELSGYDGDELRRSVIRGTDRKIGRTTAVASGSITDGLKELSFKDTDVTVTLVYDGHELIHESFK